MAENELDEAKRKLQEAHDAEDRLRQTMPDAIQPDETEDPGTPTPLARGVDDAPGLRARTGTAMEAGEEETDEDSPHEDSPHEDSPHEAHG